MKACVSKYVTEVFEMGPDHDDSPLKGKEGAPEEIPSPEYLTLSRVAWMDWDEIRFPDPVSIDLSKSRAEIATTDANLKVE